MSFRYKRKRTLSKMIVSAYLPDLLDLKRREAAGQIVLLRMRRRRRMLVLKSMYILATN